MTMTLIEGALIVFVVACALGAAFLKDILSSVIAFAAYSLGVSIIWLILQAPDVGLTEAAVGAGIMTILFLLAMANTVRPEETRYFEAVRLRSVVGIGAFVLVLVSTVPALPAIGDPNAPVVAGDVTQFYIANAYKETGVKNAVTAVLAAYRGFDTLGEVVVVFVAGIAALTVLREEVFA